VVQVNLERAAAGMSAAAMAALTVGAGAGAAGSLSQRSGYAAPSLAQAPSAAGAAAAAPAARRILLPTVKGGMYQPVQGLPGGVMPPPGAVGGRAGNALRSYYRAHGS